MVYETMDNEKLSNMLMQNPNIVISQAKRNEVENYRKNKMLSQQSQQ